MRIVFGVVVDDGVLLLGRYHANLAAHVVGNKLDKLVSHGLGDGENLAQHEQTLDDVVGRHAQSFGEFADRGALHDLDDAVVEHQVGIDALFDGLHSQTFALSGLALFLTLLTTTFALVARSGGDGSARLRKNLVALELFSLHGHLGITVFAGRVRKLGNVGLEMMPAALAALTFTALLFGSARRSGCLLVRLLCADARLFRLDLESRESNEDVAFGAGAGLFAAGAGLDAAFFEPRARFSATALRFATSAASLAARASAACFARRASSAAFCSSIWRARLERPEDTGAGAGFFLSVGLPAF